MSNSAATTAPLAVEMTEGPVAPAPDVEMADSPLGELPGVAAPTAIVAAPTTTAPQVSHGMGLSRTQRRNRRARALKRRLRAAASGSGEGTATTHPAVPPLASAPIPPTSAATPAAGPATNHGDPKRGEDRNEAVSAAAVQTAGSGITQPVRAAAAPTAMTTTKKRRLRRKAALERRRCEA